MVVPYPEPGSEAEIPRFLTRKNRFGKTEEGGRKKAGSHYPATGTPKRYDRDATMFVLSTIRRLIDEERFVAADEDSNRFLSTFGLKSGKSKPPATRSGLREAKTRKTGTRYPQPEVEDEPNNPIGAKTSLDEMVEKAKEIIKVYREVWWK